MGLEQVLIQTGKEFLSEKRWNHCLRTAEYGTFLANKFSADAVLVRLACLSHDLAREKEAEEIRKWAMLDQKELSDFCLSRPVLLHGFASAWLLRRDFGVEDESLLNAVRYHTTGHPLLDREGLIVFAADFMEPGRIHLTEADRDCLLKLELDDLVIAILESMEKYLVKQNEKVSPDSRELYHKLKKRYNEAP